MRGVSCTLLRAACVVGFLHVDDGLELIETGVRGEAEVEAKLLSTLFFHLLAKLLVTGWTVPL